MEVLNVEEPRGTQDSMHLGPSLVSGRTEMSRVLGTTGHHVAWGWGVSEGTLTPEGFQQRLG